VSDIRAPLVTSGARHPRSRLLFSGIRRGRWGVQLSDIHAPPVLPAVSDIRALSVVQRYQTRAMSASGVRHTSRAAPPAASDAVRNNEWRLTYQPSHPASGVRRSRSACCQRAPDIATLRPLPAVSDAGAPARCQRAPDTHALSVVQRYQTWATGKIS
jgi:hypothetical protein